MSAQPRSVLAKVAALVLSGKTLMTYKTKPRAHGGRQLVSVGPYQLAVGKRKYAVITKLDSHEYTTARMAAEVFIDFVGRDHAWAASMHPGRAE